MLKRIASSVAIATILSTLGLVESVKAEIVSPEFTQEQTRENLEPPLVLAESGSKTITEIAVSNDSFKILALLVKAAGLADTLNSQGPFTVFAPTDLAFAKLPRGTLGSLVRPENKDNLIKILTYHVVSGEVTSKAVPLGQEVSTVEGSPIEAETKRAEGGVRELYINDAKVIQPDVQASNGVIHVIDKVLLPPNE